MNSIQKKTINKFPLNISDKECPNKLKNNNLISKLYSEGENKKIIIKSDNEETFDNPESLFDFVFQNEDEINIFMNTIEQIIDIMMSILYTSPYSILFGRININTLSINTRNNINELFYEGFGSDIL